MLHRISSFVKYWLYQVNEHSLQAPFIYDLYTQVILKAKHANPYPKIEELRKVLRQSAQIIEVEDFGAGSGLSSNKKRSISSIAKYGITKLKYAVLMDSLIRYLKYSSIIELGTSLGINTLYLAQGDNRKVVTFEGDPTLSNLAKSNFNKFNLGNIDLVSGRIEDTLGPQLASVEKIDFAFVDAHHNYDATLRNFETLSRYLHRNGCIIFDDIHWSNDMERAWRVIKHSPTVSLSIDIFQMGIVFLNPDYGKQDYILAY